MRAPRIRRITAVAAVALAAGLTLSACGSGNSTGARDSGASPASGRTGATASTDSDLTAEEAAGVQWMREEEKLAHDVYTTLGDRWNLPIFSNIAASEQTHTNAVAGVIDAHALTDPAATTALGEFANADIQRLYDSLVAQGSASSVAALTVGATIEDLDLADLADRATDTPDIAAVYANLERGSRNHLRAFTRQLDNAGASYTPSHITQTEYDAIVAGDVERGGGRGA